MKEKGCTKLFTLAILLNFLFYSICIQIESFQEIQQKPCVEVFSQCNYKGDSTSSCDGNLTNFDHEIYSVKIEEGTSLVIHVEEGLQIHLKTSQQCFSEPINKKENNIRIESFVNQNRQIQNE